MTSQLETLITIKINKFGNMAFLVNFGMWCDLLNNLSLICFLFDDSSLFGNRIKKNKVILLQTVIFSY